MFWDQTTETLERPALEQLQLKRLQETVARVAARVAVYQERFAKSGLRAADIRSLRDLRRLPFTTSADLRATYPDGLLAVDRSKVSRLHTSSGTTGKPKALFFSRQDVENARGVDCALPDHDRGDAGRRAAEHDDLRPVHRRAGHALRRGKGRAAWSSRPARAIPSGSSC